MEKTIEVKTSTAEKMIRLEQTIAASFGKSISYDETDFYKKMSVQDKINFQEYLKNKGKKKILFILGLISPLIVLSMLKINVTGNAIRETIGEAYTGFLNWILVALFVVGLVIFFFSERENKKFDARFSSHSKVIDKILDKKV